MYQDQGLFLSFFWCEGHRFFWQRPTQQEFIIHAHQIWSFCGKPLIKQETISSSALKTAHPFQLQDSHGGLPRCGSSSWTKGCGDNLRCQKDPGIRAETGGNYMTAERGVFCFCLFFLSRKVLVWRCIYIDCTDLTYTVLLGFVMISEVALQVTIFLGEVVVSNVLMLCTILLHTYRPKEPNKTPADAFDFWLVSKTISNLPKSEHPSGFASDGRSVLATNPNDRVPGLVPWRRPCCRSHPAMWKTREKWQWPRHLTGWLSASEPNKKKQSNSKTKPKPKPSSKLTATTPMRQSRQPVLPLTPHPPQSSVKDGSGSSPSKSCRRCTPMQGSSPGPRTGGFFRSLWPVLGTDWVLDWKKRSKNWVSGLTG